MENTLLEELNRKKIRYILFRLKNSTAFDDAKQVFDAWGFDLPEEKCVELIEDIKTHYSSQKGFTTFGGFCDEWDLGIDDTVLEQNRPEKWWLFGESHLNLIARNGRADGPTRLEIDTARGKK